jgi:hypothetical protein
MPIDGRKVIPIDRSRYTLDIFRDHRELIISEQDERSLALTEIDVTTIRLEHMLKPAPFVRADFYVQGFYKIKCLSFNSCRS